MQVAQGVAVRMASNLIGKRSLSSALWRKQVQDKVIGAIDTFAPLTMADTTWDNVGLLVDASLTDSTSPLIEQDDSKQQSTAKVLLTIDLTRSVALEALQLGAAFIVAYHPPIFAPVKRVSLQDARIGPAMTCLAAGISVYSPHTAFDSCKGGINDWLASAFKSATVTPISEVPGGKHPIDSGVGVGRIVRVNEKISIREAVEIIKAHLGLKFVRVGQSPHHSSLDEKVISSIALCAGSGSSVLKNVKADLYWTGEMSHHDVLYANSKMSSVVLCEHTNTERGFLASVLQPRLTSLLPSGEHNIEFVCSQADADPLRII
jgi:dinuclear metal center YbgI/SA1388 family protein